MSGPMHGADADELDRLAVEFNRAADQLDRESGALSGILNNISWLGYAAGRYLSDWTGFQMPKIGLSTQFLRETALVLSSQAVEQRAASDSAGGRSRSGVGLRGRVDARQVSESVDRVRGWLDTGGFGVTARDLELISEEFVGLDPAERAAVFARLTDAELRVFKDQMQESAAKGGWHAAEQASFLQMLLPSLSPDEARRLMGPEWAQIRGELPHAAQPTPKDFAGDLLRQMDATQPDEIQIRQVGLNEYVVVLPGVSDLSAGFEAGVDGLGGGLPGFIGSAVDEWEGTNATNSARDMHYARQSEMERDNGSVNGNNGYAFAVKQAMLASGVPQGANVMLVGHSFGAYTAAELATDPSFNSPGSYHVTHVLGAGASTSFRMNDLPPGTQGLLINNARDAVYIGEVTLGTNNESYAHEVVFGGGGAGVGHATSNYSEFLSSTNHPGVDEFRQSAFDRYGDSGSTKWITVEDPYRYPTRG